MLHEHLSMTQLTMFRRCPIQYHYRYDLGLIIPPDGGLVRGKSVHQGIAVNMEQKKETGVDLSVSDVQEATAAAFESEAADAEFQADEKPGELKDSAVALAAMHTTDLAPTIQPLEVEREMRFSVPGVEVPFLGYIDLIDMRSTVRDTKTAGRTPQADVADKSFQLTGYAFAYMQDYGELPKAVTLDYLIATKTPKAEVRESVRTSKDIARFIGTSRMMAEAIAAENYYPNEDGWHCSPRYCGYYERCHKEVL